MKCETTEGASSPSHVLPCPRCGHRMIVRSTEVTNSLTHACQGCQIEVSRVIGNAVPQTRAA